MKYDFIVVGGAVEDINFHTEDGLVIDNPKKDILRQKLVGFEYGAKVRVKKMERFPGGGANNAAVSLSRLGFKTALLAAVGEDEAGARLFKNLSDNGVDTRLVKRVKGSETGLSFIVINKDGEHVAFVYRGASDELAVSKIEAQMLSYAKWIYLSSLSGEWEKVLDRVFSLKDPSVAWNPGNAQLLAGASKLKKYLTKTAILMVNRDEAIELAISDKKYKNKDEKFLNDPKNLLPILHGFGPQTVLITDGAGGAHFFDGEKTFYEESLHVPASKIMDTTGVGDAFCSTFVAGLESYEGDVKRSMKLAMKNSAGVLREPGAQNGLLWTNK